MIFRHRLYAKGSSGSRLLGRARNMAWRGKKWYMEEKVANVRCNNKPATKNGWLLHNSRKTLGKKCKTDATELFQLKTGVEGSCGIYRLSLHSHWFRNFPQEVSILALCVWAQCVLAGLQPRQSGWLTKGNTNSFLTANLTHLNKKLEIKLLRTMYLRNY